MTITQSGAKPRTDRLSATPSSDLTGTQASIRQMHGIRLNAVVDLDGNVDQYEVEAPGAYSLHTDRGLAFVAYADALDSLAYTLTDVDEVDRLQAEAVAAIRSAFGA